MTDNIKAKCAKCGKDFELPAKYAGFVEKCPDRVMCPECKFGNKSTGTSKPVSHSITSKSVAPVKQPVSAEMFVKAYDELTAAFEGRVDEVKEYLGGWASTIVINRSR